MEPTSSGIGFAGILTLIFITLKLCKVITWSWIWVLSPLWIGFALGLAFVALFLVIGLIVALLR